MQGACANAQACAATHTHTKENACVASGPLSPAYAVLHVDSTRVLWGMGVTAGCEEESNGRAGTNKQAPIQGDCPM